MLGLFLMPFERVKAKQHFIACLVEREKSYLSVEKHLARSTSNLLERQSL